MILVTGAAGFIGQHVTEALTDDHDVRGMVLDEKDTDKIESLGAEPIVGDITDPEDCAEACEGIDTIVHLVGILQGSPGQFREIHVEGTRNLLEQAEELERFIHISALGADSQATPYFTTKFQAEQLVRDSGHPYTIFRPSIVFGSEDSFINLLIDQVRSLPVVPILGDGSYRLQPIYVEDLASIIADALNSEESIEETFELGGPGIVTLEQLTELIADHLEVDKPTVHVPLSLARLGAPFARTVMDVPLDETTIAMLEQENFVRDHHYTDVFDVKLHSLEDLFDRLYLED